MVRLSGDLDELRRVEVDMAAGVWNDALNYGYWIDSWFGTVQE